MRLGPAIDLWIGEMARRGRSRATRDAYERIYTAFARTIDRERDINTITTDECRAFLDRWRNASPATLAQRISALRVFFRFLEVEGKIDRTPMLNIERPRRPRPEDTDVVTVTGDEVGRMFAGCQELDEFLCIALLAYLGPRRNAAAMVRWGDIDFTNGTVRFREKGGKVNVEPVPDELREILYQVALMGDVPNAPDDYVIPNRRPGQRLTDVRFVAKRGRRSNKIVYDRVKRVAGRVGVNAHPHALRAAFAVAFDEAHPDQLIALQELMGHARIETTRVYLRRKDKARAKEQVRDLSWGFGLPSETRMPPAGFEPALQP